jgi:hypothetical protein
MNTFRSCLAFCLFALLCASAARAQERDVYGAVPSWVKVDRSVFEEGATLRNSTDQRVLAEIQEDVRQPVHEPAYSHQANSGRFSSLARNMETPLSNSSSAAFPKASDRPPENDGRPAVTTASGWRVSMPNVRRNAARMLLQRKF